MIDPNGTPDDELPAGEVGEIIVRNTDKPVWAWNDTPRIETTFENGWWYSGDLGYVDEAGYLFLEGRTDFMIKSKGIKVPPGPIENRLENHPAVDEAAVVGVPDEALPPEELDEWFLADEALARHERPRHYRITTEPLPRTVTGKLDRDTVREQVSGGAE